MIKKRFMTEKVFLSDIKPKQAHEKRFQFLAKSTYAVAENVGFVAENVGFCRDYVELCPSV